MPEGKMESILPKKSNGLPEEPFTIKSPLTKEEFEKKIKKFYPYIVKYCKKLFLGLSEASIKAEDIAQEAFIKASRKYETFRGERGDASFVLWLQRISRNTFIEHTRKLKSDPLDKRGNSNNEEIQNNEYYNYENIMDSSLSAEEKLLYKEKINELYDVINKLPEEQRFVIDLNLSMGLGPKEIAEMTGKNQGTVKANLSHAREKVLKAFGVDIPYSEISKP